MDDVNDKDLKNAMDDKNATMDDDGDLDGGCIDDSWHDSWLNEPATKLAPRTTSALFFEAPTFLEAAPTPNTPNSPVKTIANWDEFRLHQQLNLPLPNLPQLTAHAKKRRKRQKEYECECERKYYVNELRGRIRHSNECKIQRLLKS
jgi:hypothetical protein